MYRSLHSRRSLTYIFVLNIYANAIEFSLINTLFNQIQNEYGNTYVYILHNHLYPYDKNVNTHNSCIGNL